jgi:hypothetical protein
MLPRYRENGTIEVEDQAKPAAVIEMVGRHYY